MPRDEFGKRFAPGQNEVAEIWRRQTVHFQTVWKRGIQSKKRPAVGQKIERDHQRFRRIVRGKVKSNLSKYISRGEMLGKKGKDLVSIPLPQIDIPQFR